MEKQLNSAYQAWKFHRGLALDILKAISEEQLGLTIGENMGSLGQQFRHVLKIEIEYLEAIQNKKVAPVSGKLDKEIANSKERLIALFDENFKKITETLESLESEDPEKFMIDWTHWDVPEMNLIDHIQALADHTNLHNGEIIVYAKTHNIPFPKSWAPWGL
jgi:uncharacterized damage-inducible protein DinB